MLNDNGFPFILDEGIYWYDKGIIKGFNKLNGEETKIYRIFIDEKLNLTYKEYKQTQNNKYETWTDTTDRLKPSFCSNFYTIYGICLLVYIPYIVMYIFSFYQ